MGITKLKCTMLSQSFSSDIRVCITEFCCRTGSWFQFNDEIVTEIETLGDKMPAKKVTEVADKKHR